MELLRGFGLGFATCVGVAMAWVLFYGAPAQAQLREEQLVLDGKAIQVPSEQHFAVLIQRCEDPARIPQSYFRAVCAVDVRLYRNAWESFAGWRKSASLAEHLNQPSNEALTNARAQHKLALELEISVKKDHPAIFRP